MAVSNLVTSAFARDYHKPSTQIDLNSKSLAVSMDTLNYLTKNSLKKKVPF